MTLFKEVRQKYCLTQDKMARELGVSINTYRKYELGKKMPPADILVKILIMRDKGNDKKLAMILQELIKDGWYDED